MLEIRYLIFSVFLFSIASSPCGAAGQLPYGPRAGMNVTIIEMDGINTERATVRIQHTRENAKEHCADYRGDPSEACIDSVLREVRIRNSIRGNCRTGQFVNLYGENLQFAGVNYDYDAVQFGTEYRVFKAGNRTVLDSSMASGYGVNLEQFGALCPKSMNKAEMAFAARPRYVGRWFLDKKEVCNGEPGTTEGLLIYKASEFIGLENYCRIKITSAKGQRYELLNKCNGEGFRSAGREILEVSNDQLERTVFDGKKTYKISYMRCQ
jgi:hypothetical protein